MLLLCPGPLLGEVVKNIKDKRDGKMSLKRKAFIYSAVCNWTVFKSSLSDSFLSINSCEACLLVFLLHEILQEIYAKVKDNFLVLSC